MVSERPTSSEPVEQPPVASSPMGAATITFTVNALIGRVLTAALCFGAVSAVAGLLIAIPGGGGGFPVEQLEGTPFTSFVIPGLILGVVVGGTQLSAAIAMFRASPARLLFAAIAGFGMVIWIYAELALIGYSVLQTVYFALGAGELILVMVLLGVLPVGGRPREATLVAHPHGQGP
ncbi:MAG: hypothetical protein M3Y26_05235 [Actinomycetota bacterium]|nr:hypothetical protein [Actinomycetota bacterium]